MCAGKDVGMEMHKILTATETGTQEVSLDEVQAIIVTESEETERLASDLYKNFVQAMKHEAFIVIRGVEVPMELSRKGGCTRGVTAPGSPSSKGLRGADV